MTQAQETGSSCQDERFGRTADAMLEVVRDRTDRHKQLSGIEIGSVAGATAEIPSAALRAARLQMMGSARAR